MAHDLGDFVYARPYSRSEKPLSFIGAIHSFSGHATYHKYTEEAITGSRISSAVFFDSHDLIAAAFLKVERTDSREKDPVNYYTRFDDCYNLNQLDPTFSNFLEQQPAEIKTAMATLIEYAKKNEQRQTKSPSDEEYETFKPMLVKLWDQFELCDPRLSHAESLYFSGRDEYKTLTELREKLTSVSASRPSENVKSRIDELIAVKSKVSALATIKKDAEHVVTILNNTKTSGPKAARTFLYSRIKLPEKMRKSEPEAFRTQIYDMLSDDTLTNREKETILTKMLKEEIGVKTTALGFIDSTKWSSDFDKDQFYKTLGYVPGIVEGFAALKTGSWADQHLPEAQEILDNVTHKIARLTEDYAEDISYDGGQKISLTLAREAERLTELQAVFFATDVSEEDAAYINRISQRTLPERPEGTLKAGATIRLDFKLADIYNKFAAEHPEAGLENIGLSDRTEEILSDEKQTVAAIKELSADDGIRALQVHKQLAVGPKVY